MRGSSYKRFHNVMTRVTTRGSKKELYSTWAMVIMRSCSAKCVYEHAKHCFCTVDYAIYRLEFEKGVRKQVGLRVLGGSLSKEGNPN